ncbi:YjhX family toxin [Roseibium sp.]|uniref:YjhX family toxin n=1 Tax=Roseibium sp. TaxID=1936156 RepID=UPI003D14A88F
MDISKAEQQVLHLLAQGGCILVEKDEDGRVVKHETVTRDGWYWGGCSQHLFRKLKYRRLIASRNSGPYRITRLGLKRVRAQLDNR